jgi:DNA-binding HxlR family transcriptional regulator
MRWRDIGSLTCSVARALSVVGDRWTLLILRDAFLGVRRFEHFHADLGTTRHRLADRLRTLVAHGILDRVPYQERPPRFEYRLTEKGRDLYPIVVSLTRWGDRWMAGADGPPMELVHRSCGRGIVPTLTCPACREPIDPRRMEARPGPALLRKRLRRTAGRPPTGSASSDGAAAPRWTARHGTPPRRP